MPPTPAATRRVRDLARAALRVEAGEGSAFGVTPEAPEDLLAAIERQRVGPLLHKYGAALGLAAPVLAGLAETSARLQRHLMVQVLELSRLAEALDHAEVRWLSLKGPALAVQTSGEPTGRGSGDIDLLVAPDSVVTVYGLLRDLGWIARPIGSSQPGTWAWRHIRETFHEMTFDGALSTVDLHWRLEPTQDALPTLEALWSRRVEVDLGGVTVPTLGIRDAFQHTSHHAARDDWRWVRSLVDVHRLAQLPQTWSGGRLDRVELASLRVTEACLGLPTDVPSSVHEQLAGVSSTYARRALRYQEKPALAARPFPAAQTLRNARYGLLASRTPGDLRRTVIAVLIPSNAVAGMNDATAWSALPKLLVRRVRWLGGRTFGWVWRRPTTRSETSEL